MSDPRKFTNITDPRFSVWRKSTRSGNEGTCLYASESGGLVAITDSKEGSTGVVQVYPRAVFGAFVAGVKAGQFKRS